MCGLPPMTCTAPAGKEKRDVTKLPLTFETMFGATGSGLCLQRGADWRSRCRLPFFQLPVSGDEVSLESLGWKGLCPPPPVMKLKP